MKKILLPIAVLLVAASCEKKTVEPEEEPPVEVPKVEAINVLNDNSGFSHVLDIAENFSSTANLGPGGLGVLDYTLESNGNLNLAYFLTVPSQQSTFKNKKRITRNLNSNTRIAQPAGSDSVLLNFKYNDQAPAGAFLPYTNFFVYGNYTASTGFGYANKLEIGGDYTGSGVSNANPIGSYDLGFRCPASNSGTGFGYFFKNGSTLTYDMMTLAIIGGVGDQTHLSYFTQAAPHETYLGNTSTEYYAFGLTHDSLKVYQLSLSGGNSTHTVVASVPVSAIPAGVNTTSIRNYSADGKIISLLFKTNAGNNVYTFTYDFSTHTLVKKLDGVALDYSDAGSDMDVDVNGDVYYSGYAGNGSNTSGVSIYKKSNASVPVTVGADNLLKFGAIVKLKVLSGKVYFAVNGKQTGTEVYQLSIIKQN